MDGLLVNLQECSDPVADEENPRAPVADEMKLRYRRQSPLSLPTTLNRTCISIADLVNYSGCAVHRLPFLSSEVGCGVTFCLQYDTFVSLFQAK
ncbi:hypothetical protein PROFUN_02463 [Planoprotostelium fungivorum]|uniref:Uncharacterized protein n=1 Tax=Planoprotostelium fungivorum TaxID=1890364 RepID=A0A2P6NUW3_9EUKA|nr:hypothetical protein PROFUN_02463 [Planoprotostelium fungivorum]